MQHYIVMIGTSFLLEYTVSSIGLETEWTAKISDTGKGPFMFDDIGRAKTIANHFGGTVVTVEDEEHD